MKTPSSNPFVNFQKFNRRFRNSFPSVLAVCGAMAWFPQASEAANITWDGDAVLDGWNDPVNWGGDVLPGAADTVFFSSAGLPANTVISLGASQTIRNLNFTPYSGTPTFTIGSAADNTSGYTFTLTNVYRGDNIGNSSQTIAANVVLAADSTWNILNGYGGSVAVTGGIGSASAVTFTKDGFNGLSLGGVNTFTGSLRVLAGSLTLNNTNAYTGTTTVSGGGLNVNFATSTSTDTINSASGLVLGGIRGGGSVTVTGKNVASSINSQTFSGLTLNSGASSMSIVNGIASGKTLVALGGITRNTGSTVNFNQPTVFTTISAQNGYTTSTSNDASGILGAYATVGGTDWASNNVTNIVAYTGYTVLAGAAPNIVDGANTNVRISSGSTGDVGQSVGTVTVNTLNANDAAARIVTVGTGNTLRLGAVGGILSTGTNGLTVGGASGNAGTLTAGGADNTAGEVILNNSTALVVNSVVANNGSGAVALTKSGSGTTTLAATNTHTGSTTVNGGVLAFAPNTIISSATTSGSSTVTVASTVGLVVGQTVTGSGIPSSAKIASINVDGIHYTLNQTATATAPAVNLVYYTGGTTNAMSTAGDITVNGGTLEMGSTSAAQTTSGAVVVASGTLNNGTLTKSGANYDVRSGTISTQLAGAVGLDKTTAGSLTFANTVANTYTGTTTINEGSVVGGAVANVTAINGNLVVGTSDGSGSGASFANANSNVTFNRTKNVTIYSNGSVSFGGGAQNLDGTINIIGGSLGGTQIYQNAVINMTGGTYSGTSFGTTNSFTSNASPTTAVVSGYLASSVLRTFTVADGAAATDLLLSSTSASNGSLAKAGAGRMVISSNLSHTGTTTVTGGNLVVNGSMANTSTTTVSSGAGLGGDGTIGGSATYNSGSKLPWTVSNWTAGPTLDAGTVTMNGTVTVVVDESSLVNFTNATKTFTILSATNLTVGTVVVDASGFTSGAGTWTAQKTGNTLELVYTSGAAPIAFGSWALGKGLDGTAGKENGVAADPDGDGKNNLAEFAFDGNPLNGSDSGKFYSLIADSSDVDVNKELILTVAVRKTAPVFAGTPSPVSTVDGITYTIQGSSDLAAFSTSVSVVAPVITGLPTPGADYEYRSFSLDGSNLLSGRGFLRAMVTQP